MTQFKRPPTPPTAPGVKPAATTRRVERWENEGGAVVPPARGAAAPIARGGPVDRPAPASLYADLLAEADRRRQATDDRLVRGMIALRDPLR